MIWESFTQKQFATVKWMYVIYISSVIEYGITKKSFQAVKQMLWTGLWPVLSKVLARQRKSRNRLGAKKAQIHWQKLR